MCGGHSEAGRRAGLCAWIAGDAVRIAWQTGPPPRVVERSTGIPGLPTSPAYLASRHPRGMGPKKGGRGRLENSNPQMSAE